MFTILLADNNLENMNKLSQHLLEDFNVSIVCETKDNNILSSYINFKPDIVLMNQNVVKNYNKILNRICDDKRNVIMSVSQDNYNSDLAKFSKIYRIMCQPVKYEYLKKTLKQFALDNNLALKNLDYLFLRNLFSKLNFNVDSKGAKYLMFAVNECYKNIDLLEKDLNYIYNIVSKHFASDNVKSSIRSSLRPFNRFKGCIKDKELFSFFNMINGDLSVKKFLEIMITYLLNAKK